MRSRRGILLGAIALLILPFAVYAGSPAERDFDTVVHLKPNLSHGRELFDTCAACHGTSGAGVSDGTVPAIAAQHFKVIVWALVGYRPNDRLDPRMKHFTGPHHLADEQDIADVATYISQLQPAKSVQHGNGEHIARGASVYESRCASCHGANASGDDEMRYPRLAGQHYGYLLLQLGDTAVNRWSSQAQQHMHSVHTLAPFDVAIVGDYLSRLGP